MRRHHLLRAVGRVADLEIFVVGELDDEARSEMASLYGARVGAAPPTAAPASGAAALVRSVRHAGSPTRVGRGDWPLLRRAVRSWMSTYDLTLVERVEDYLILGPVLQEPVVVDLDDRESDVLRQIRPLLRRAGDDGARPGPAARTFSGVRKAGRELYLMLDEYRWRRAERLVLRRADSVLVASHEDLTSFGYPDNGVVVPNGFELRGAPVGSGAVHSPPTVAFWGLMAYRPNRDGAQWFLKEVLPGLLRRVPDVRVLLIGGGGESLTLPEDGPVTATGFVEDLSTHLAATDVAFVPLRAGGGTRIKIIEAWANHIPVVSTSLGAYGLGGLDGENILLADDGDGFAAALASAVEDRALRDRLIAGGAVRAAALRWSTIERTLSDHLAEVVQAPPEPSRRYPLEMPPLRRDLRNRLSRANIAVGRRTGWAMAPWPLPNSLTAELKALLTGLGVTHVVDVGAHRGGFGHRLRTEVGYRGPITSFEASPSHYRDLRDVAAADPEWSLMNVALGAEPGVAEFHHYQGDGQFDSLRSLSPHAAVYNADLALKETIPVTVERLDAVWPQLGAEPGGTFLKVDTQGYDLEVLAGAGDLMTEFPAVLLEVAVEPLYEGAPVVAEVFAAVAGYGFELTGAFPIHRYDRGLRVIEFDCTFVNRRLFDDRSAT